MTTDTEQNITYRLVKVKGDPAKNRPDMYRAVSNHRLIDAKDVIREIAEASDLNETRLMYAGSNIFETMIRKTLADGHTRRFGDWFDLRLDIEGTVDRIDAPFDPNRQKVVLNLIPGKRFADFCRTKPPENERLHSRGRIDYVTYPGGDHNEIMFGKDILIYGHDLTLTADEPILLSFRDATGWLWRGGTSLSSPNSDDILEHDATHIRVKWLGPKDPQQILGRKTTIFCGNATCSVVVLAAG